MITELSVAISQLLLLYTLIYQNVFMLDQHEKEKPPPHINVNHRPMVEFIISAIRGYFILTFRMIMV